MRRIWMVLVCCALAQLSVPTRADAWWDFVEQFSGPGPFKGFDVESRLVCFVDKPVDSANPAPRTEIRAFAVPGILYSACKLKDYEGERRRASIDFGMRFVWKGDDLRFANGHRISLTTTEPAVSWRVINVSSGSRWEKWDVFDYGVGVGFYWISSTEFRSVRGGFLEPVRLDFHAPPTAKWGFRIPAVRYGLLVFPGGFEPGAFGAKPDVAHRISRDWVNTFSIYADLEPLLNKLK